MGLAFACARGTTISDDLPLDRAPNIGSGDGDEGDEEAGDGSDAGDDGEIAREDAGTPAYDAGELADSGPVAPAFSYLVSNVDPAQIDLASAPAATLDCGVTRIDTSQEVSLSNWCGTPPTPTLRAQAGGPELVVIPLAGLTIERASRLLLSGDRPVLLLVAGDATINGTIDASADDAIPGAGGNVDCGASSGSDGVGREGLNGGGGGGGGFGSAGGAGGDDRGGGSSPGLAGVARGNPELVPLLAGCGGGLGGGCVGNRGAGGGAVQISASGALVIDGAVRADGSQGEQGCDNDSGGAGGGSGGGVLLEAESIDASGAIFSVVGGDGGAGQDDGAPGAGSTEEQRTGGVGEAGGGSGAGGGGGGFGRVRLRAATSCVGC